MTPAQQFNQEQRERWGGVEGQSWVEHQERMDRLLQPVLAALLEFAAPRPGFTVIDVGCGCGATSVELARAAGPSGRVIAMDLSKPMLGRAAERLREFPQATCLLGDAAELPLSGFNAELMVSRFGVMFFGDPAAAFTNLRTGLAPRGRLRFVCWRPFDENAWFQIPLHAVYEHVPRLPKPEPEEPGPFSFADPARVTRILTAAGFRPPSFTRLDLELDLAAGGTLEDAVNGAMSVGPAKRALADQPDEIRAAAAESIRRALAPRVKLPAAMWLVGSEA